MPRQPIGVAITGAEAIVAGCVGRSVLWERLQRDQVVPDQRLAGHDLALLSGLRDAERAVLSRQKLLGLAAADQAWQQAGLPLLRQPLRAERHAPLAEPWWLRAGVVSASALGNVSALLAEIGSPDHRAAA